MSTIEINGSETEQIHLFHINLPPEAIERFTVQAGTGEWPLKYALGATKLRTDFVDVVAISDLGQMTLSNYMTTAHNATGTAFDEARARIDALTGHVLLLPTQAFAHTSQTLTIGAPLKYVGSFAETRARKPGPRVRSASARSPASGGANGAKPARIPVLFLAGFVLLALLGIFITLRM